MENIFDPKWAYIKPNHYLEHWQVKWGTLANYASAVIYAAPNGEGRIADLQLSFLDKENEELRLRTTTIKAAKVLVIDKIKEAWEI